MKVSRIIWYAGTVFTTLAMLAASTTAVAQRVKDADRARQAPQRNQPHRNQ
jgi:hypothetical protein